MKYTLVYDFILNILYYILAYIQHNRHVSLANYKWQLYLFYSSGFSWSLLRWTLPSIISKLSLEHPVFTELTVVSDKNWNNYVATLCFGRMLEDGGRSSPIIIMLYWLCKCYHIEDGWRRFAFLHYNCARRMTQICVFNNRLFSLHNTLNYAIHRACLRMVLLTDVYRNLTSLWINL